jgi:hypothetical protein
VPVRSRRAAVRVDDGKVSETGKKQRGFPTKTGKTHIESIFWKNKEGDTTISGLSTPVSDMAK